MKATALALALGLLFTACGLGYGPREDHSQFTSAKLADDGNSILFTFHRFEYRRATGMRAFPDGGIPKYLTDEHVVGVYDRAAGKVRILKDEKNKRWQPGSGTYTIHSTRGSKILVAQGGQLRGAVYANDIRYLLADFVTGAVFDLDLKEDLALYGRDPGPIYLVDNAGTLLFETQSLGGAADTVPELWVRLTTGDYVKVATTEHYETTRNGEVIYWVLDTRSFMAFSLATRTTRPAPEYKPAGFHDVTVGVILSSDRTYVEYGTKTNDVWTYTATGLTDKLLDR